MIRGQLSLDEYTDPFGSFVLPRYFEGRPVYEYLQLIALHIAAEKGAVTADDLREYCPPETNRKVLGAALGALKRKGALKPVQYVRSGVPTNHGRGIWVYALTDEGRELLEELKGWESSSGTGASPGRGSMEGER